MRRAAPRSGGTVVIGTSRVGLDLDATPMYKVGEGISFPFSLPHSETAQRKVSFSDEQQVFVSCTVSLLWSGNSTGSIHGGVLGLESHLISSSGLWDLNSPALRINAAPLTCTFWSLVLALRVDDCRLGSQKHFPAAYVPFSS